MVIGTTIMFQIWLMEHQGKIMTTPENTKFTLEKIIQEHCLMKNQLKQSES